MYSKKGFIVLILALAFLLVFPTLAVAENSTLGEGVSDAAMSSESDLFTQMNNNIEIYNENVGSVPSFVKNFVDDKEILFTITLDDGSEMTVHGSTDEKGVFVLFEEINDTSGLEDALLVRSDESTVREIMNSSDPAHALRLALKEKTVVIENASFFEGIVLWFAKSSLADILF